MFLLIQKPEEEFTLRSAPAQISQSPIRIIWPFVTNLRAITKTESEAKKRRLLRDPICMLKSLANTKLCMNLDVNPKSM